MTCYETLMSYNVRESTFHRPDNTSLFVRHWGPTSDAPKAQLLILHGYLEHGGRYAPLAEYLATLDIATHAYDMRGHGHSNGQRAYVKHFGDYLDDADAIFASLDSETPAFVLGHSNGGLIALDWFVTRRPKAQGLIVTNPFLAMAEPLHGPKKWAGRIASRVAPRMSLPAGLRSEQMTHDPLMLEAHRHDPLIIKVANASWHREATIAQERVLGYRRVPTPLLYVRSSADPIASPDVSRRFAQQLDSPDKHVVERAGELHEVLNETHRQTLFALIGDWIAQRSGMPVKN